MLHPHPSPIRPPKNNLWSYKADGIEFSADSFPELVIKIRTHLSAKLLTISEVEQLILENTALTCPWLVLQSHDDAPVNESQRIFREYITHVGSKEFVEDDIAEYRIGVCRECPCNKPCQLDDEAERRLFLLTLGNPHRSLGYCSLFRHHNAVACLIEGEQVANPDAPAQCWKALTATANGVSLT